MLAKDRQKIIADEVTKTGSVSLIKLVEQLNCSQATIRRDLATLEKQNKLKRVHGGAVAVQEAKESALAERFEKNWHIKQEVATLAMPYLKQAKTIFLDAGTATHAVIPYLDAQKHYVFTNGVHHLPKLIEYGISVCLIGGDLKHNTQALVGLSAVQQLAQYYFDLAIMGTNSVDKAFGLSTPDIEEALLKKQAILHTKQAIVLCDGSKFDTHSLHHFASLEQVTLLSNTCPFQYEDFVTTL